MTGAITTHVDAVQLLVAAFFVFFLGLVGWLRREDKREGYPMVDRRPVRGPIEGFPPAPPPKPYQLLDGDVTQMPHDYGSSRARGERLLRFEGAPLVPVGDPMLAELGPGAFPLRRDEPLMAQGEPQLMPLRLARDWHVARGDTDPRGLAVYDQRHRAVGLVADLWVDRGVKILRYLEVALDLPGSAGRRVLLPIYYADISGRRRWVRVRALLAPQFLTVPALADQDRITAREEDRVNAYYASGALFSRGAPGGLTAPLGDDGAGP